MKTRLLPIGLGLLTLLSVVAVQAQAGSPAARRQALLQQAQRGAAAVPALAAALADENLVVRRTAVRLLAELGTPARPALEGALTNSDALVRRAALGALCNPPTADSVPFLKTALQDSEPLTRFTAVSLLVLVKPRTQEIQDLLVAAQQDEAQQVREVASSAVWPFFRETVSLRDRKDWDHDIKVSQTIPVPPEGWRFQKDAKANGHTLKWFEPAFDDSKWTSIKIGQIWEDQIGKYDGLGWYRGSFDLPAKPQCLGVELAFGGVDEVAWVWVNGKYAGQHDLGTEGWDKPFTLDVSNEVIWGGKNQITVRVYDSSFAGGIYKPIDVQVLQ